MFPPLPNVPTQPVAPKFGEADIVRRSASTVSAPAQLHAEVAKLIDISKCIGCKACQVACSEWNELEAPIGTNHGTYDNPTDLSPAAYTVMRYAEWDNPETGNLEWLIRKDGCMHCADPGCLKACPSPGAIVQYSNGIVDFNSANCIGCGYCVKGCPFNIPRISQTTHKASKCTLCSDRVAVGQGPACAKACPTQAIVFGTKEEMKKHADGRIKDLQSRGFAKAGLYDPQGVGGTHVMYVMSHADKPELYSGLPNNPKISDIVGLWKGGGKVAGLAAMAVAAAAGVMHYLKVGPQRVEEKDERAAKALVDGERR
jgi:formate dehydrogenase iron-sulfur subunit